MADPNPQIRRGPGHPDPETRWRGGCLKFLFRAFGPQFGPKIREGEGGGGGGGGGGARAPSLDPPLIV